MSLDGNIKPGWSPSPVSLDQTLVLIDGYQQIGLKITMLWSKGSSFHQKNGGITVPVLALMRLLACTSPILSTRIMDFDPMLPNSRTVTIVVLIAIVTFS